MLRAVPTNTLTLTVFREGKSLSVYLATPSKAGILFDVPQGSVARDVFSQNSWYSRSLQAVFALESNPKAQSGLPAVLEGFEVKNVFDTVTVSELSGSIFDALSKAKQNGTHETLLSRGQRFEFDGVTIDVLSPEREDGNLPVGALCSSVRVQFGITSFLLLCDSSAGMFNYLASLDGVDLKSNEVVVMAGLPSDASRVIQFAQPERIVAPVCDDNHPMERLICPEKITFITDGTRVRTFK